MKQPTWTLPGIILWIVIVVILSSSCKESQTPHKTPRPTPTVVQIIRVRSEPMIVSVNELTTVFALDDHFRPLTYRPHHFEAQGMVI